MPSRRKFVPVNAETAEALRAIYTQPEQRGSFGGIQRLYAAAREAGLEVSQKQVRTWLHSQAPYTVFHRQRVRFPRRSIDTFVPDYLWEADLAELTGKELTTPTARYLLIVIDTFSKFLYCEPMPRKTAPVVVQAFETIFRRAGKTPQKLYTDEGSEFISKEALALFERHGIHAYTAKNPETGAPMAERVIQEIKKRIVKHKEFYGGIWMPSLQAIVAGYNAETHSTIGMAPKDVTSAHIDLIRARLLEANRERKGEHVAMDFAYVLWQVVQIRITRWVFMKGYHPQFSRGLYIITGREHTIPVTYRVSIYNPYVQEPVPDSELDASFYEQELIPFVVAPPPGLERMQQNRLLDAEAYRGVEEQLEARAQHERKQAIMAAGLPGAPRVRHFVEHADRERDLLASVKLSRVPGVGPNDMARVAPELLQEREDIQAAKTMELLRDLGERQKQLLKKLETETAKAEAGHSLPGTSGLTKRKPEPRLPFKPHFEPIQTRSRARAASAKVPRSSGRERPNYTGLDEEDDT